MDSSEVVINVKNLPEVIDIIKQLKAERDYYRNIVKTHAQLYYIEPERNAKSNN